MAGIDLRGAALTSQQVAGLAGTYAARRASLIYDPTAKPNGAIGAAADTGQALTAFVESAVNPAPLSISGGAIVTTTPGTGTNAAGYLQANMGARVRRFGAMVSWPTSALGVAAFVIPSAPWSDGALANAGFHMSINGNGIWTLIRYSSGGNTTLASSSTHGRFTTVWGTGYVPFDFWLDPDNNRCVIIWPDGTTTTVVNAYLGSDTGNYAVWELFENAGTDVPASFGTLWADTAPVSPDVPALTPYRRTLQSPVPPPAEYNASGALTCDLSATSIHVPTLTGNLTSFAFSNPVNQRQDIEVHFIQDATGSRTLAGASASIKWAGGVAPTLTTTAGRRDIFRFRNVLSVYYEISRSMNVG